MSRRPPPIRASAALLAALAAAGCHSTAPPPPVEARPEVEVPPRYTAADEAGAPAAGQLPEHWWTALGDPVLDALVLEALAANHDLEAATARIAAARAQAAIAGADLLPQANGSADATRRRQNFIGFPIPGAPDGGERVLSTTSTSLGVSLNVSWEADLWGRLAAGVSAARADVEASEADLSASFLSVAGQTAKAYFAVVESEAQAELAATTAESRELTAERIYRRYAAGLVPGLDLRLARVLRSTAEAQAAASRRAADAARRQLEVLLGRYPAGRAPLSVPAAPRPTLDAADGGPPAEAGETAAVLRAERLPEPPSPPPVGLPAELLLRRPDLAAAERRLAAAGARVEEARKALLPRLTLAGGAGRRAQEAEDLLDDDFSVWNLAGNLLAPIFQGGRLRAAVELAEARRRELLAGYFQRTLSAWAEVETALAAEVFLDEQVAALEAAAGQAAASLEQAEERYVAGLADVLTVLEAERQALDARRQLLSARRQRLDARVDLYLALGGGFGGIGPSAPIDGEPR